MDKLIKTFNDALAEWEVIRAIRLDFSLPASMTSEEQAVLDIPDLLTAYQKLNDRLRKKISLKRNWKVEFSEDKGLHIHTVYYFDSKQVTGFNLKANLYKTICGWWGDITNEKGIINLVPSYKSDSDNAFATSGQPHYSTLLTKNTSHLNTTSKEAYLYNIQKNKHHCPAGWVHWISYLAKDEQNANDHYKKCLG